jgi:hypothetical protein
MVHEGAIQTRNFSCSYRFQLRRSLPPCADSTPTLQFVTAFAPGATNSMNVGGSATVPSVWAGFGRINVASLEVLEPHPRNGSNQAFDIPRAGNHCGFTPAPLIVGLE